MVVDAAEGRSVDGEVEFGEGSVHIILERQVSLLVRIGSRINRWWSCWELLLLSMILHLCSTDFDAIVKEHMQGCGSPEEFCTFRLRRGYFSLVGPRPNFCLPVPLLGAVLFVFLVPLWAGFVLLTVPLTLSACVPKPRLQFVPRPAFLQNLAPPHSPLSNVGMVASGHHAPHMLVGPCWYMKVPVCVM